MSFLGTPLADFLSAPTGTPGTATNTGLPGAPYDPVQAAGAAVNKWIGGKVSNAAGSAVSGLWAGLSGERIVTVIIGLVLIAAGVFMFKPVKETIVTAGKTAAKVAA